MEGVEVSSTGAAVLPTGFGASGRRGGALICSVWRTVRVLRDLRGSMAVEESSMGAAVLVCGGGASGMSWSEVAATDLLLAFAASGASVIVWLIAPLFAAAGVAVAMGPLRYLRMTWKSSACSTLDAAGVDQTDHQSLRGNALHIARPRVCVSL